MGRSPCCDDNHLKRGPWMPEEDEKLIDYIRRNGGHGSWRMLPKLAGLNRCGKSCRLRWANYLRPDIKRGKFSEEEERIIINLHSALGNKWSRIATHLPGRTDNEIKNFWNTHLKRKLFQMGIDPTTHKSRTDLNFLMNLSSQFFSSPNFGNLMLNPWDSTAALRLQADANQLAKIHMLQNLLQVMNNTSNSFPNLERGSHLLGSLNSISPFEGFLPNGTSTLYSTYPTIPAPEFPNPGVTQQQPSDYQASPTSWTCFEGGFNSSAVHSDNDNSLSSSYDTQRDKPLQQQPSDYQASPTSWTCFEGGFNSSAVHSDNDNSLSSSYDTQRDKPLPPLISSSHEYSSFNDQMGTDIINPAYISTQSPPPSSFFEDWAGLMDDETNSAFWKDIIG